MKELHIKLSGSETGDYQAEIIAPPLGAEGFDLPTSLDWPCTLELPAPISGKSMLTDFQGYLLSLKQNESFNELKPIGAYLHNFLFGPSKNRNALYTYWLDCFKKSREDGGMRTVLELDSPALIGVPWELWNSDGRYFALLREAYPFTLVRAAWKADDLAKESVPLADCKTLEPLRVLLLISHSCADDKLIQGPDEALGVDRALFKLLPWMVDLHVLTRPTTDEIQYWCEKWEPHVFHFVGHGGVTATGDPYLKLYERGKSGATLIDQDAMINLFGAKVPRLVVLNACRSGQVGDAGANANAAKATQSFSERLIQEGVLAVIAMQADIKGEDAIKLMRKFYEGLSDGQSIDEALTTARDLSFGQVLNTRKWAWALPALYLAKGVCAEDILLLDDAEAKPKVFPNSANNQYDIANNQHLLPLSMGVKIHVGRENEQLMLGKMLLAPDLSNIPPIMLLHGVEDVGKTVMLCWLSEGCARRRRPFIYADFGRTTLKYWDVLRLIRDGHLATVNGVTLCNNLDTDMIFNTFNYTLNCKSIKDYAIEHPNVPDSSTAVKDLAPESDPTTKMEELGTVLYDENPLDTITNAFWNDLTRAAEPNGLIIFLDHNENMFPGTVNDMQKYFIERVLTPGNCRVRLVITVRDSDPFDEQLLGRNDLGQAWDFLAQKDSSQVQKVKFEGLPPEQLHWLAKVWARRYFICCCDSTPIKNVLATHNIVHLQPQDVDAYVTRQVDSYLGKTLIAPGSLIKRLLDRKAIKVWLSTL